jgi:hypothetical protein
MLVSMRSAIAPAHLVAVLLLGCSKDAETPRQPVYEADYEVFPCGHSVILDADGRLWFESGCEAQSSGTNRVRDATPDEVSRVTTAFSALPASSEVTCGTRQPFGGGVLRTLRYRVGGHDVVLSFVGDPSPLVAAFESAYSILDGLVPHKAEIDASTD